MRRIRPPQAEGKEEKCEDNTKEEKFTPTQQEAKGGLPPLRSGPAAAENTTEANADRPRATPLMQMPL